MKRKLKHLKTILIIIILTFTIMFYISNQILVISKFELTIKDLPAGFNNYKILQLSDLHSKSFGNDNNKLIHKINELDFDLIVLTGDMVNSYDTDFQVFLDLAETLVSLAPTYYIVGNHEQSLNSSLLDSLINDLKLLGVVVLDNEKVTLKENNDEIDLYGMWFNLKYYSDQRNQVVINDPATYYFDESKFNLIFPKPLNKFSILLTHNPMYFETYATVGFNLTISGHVHGGSLRLPYLGGVFSPEKVLFPKYDAGNFQIEDSELIVSRGLGNGQGNFRFLNQPEIVLITLKQN